MRAGFDVEERCSTERRHLQTETFNRSKVSYTRKFLLSVKGLAVCGGLPGGLGSSILHDLTSADAPDSYENYRETDGRLDMHSDKKGSQIEEYYCSDFRRPNEVSHSFSEAGRLESGIISSMPQKHGAYQLNKSKNPYRPPHSYKIGERNFEVDRHSMKHNIAHNKLPEMKSSGDSVTVDTEQTSSLSLTDDTHNEVSGSVKSSLTASDYIEAGQAQRSDLLDCDADEVDARALVSASSSRYCPTIPDQNICTVYKDKIDDDPFTQLKDAFPLAIDGSTRNDQAFQPVSEMEFESCRTSYEFQRDVPDMILRDHAPEPCGSPYMFRGFDFLHSVIGEFGQNESGHGEFPLKREENECSFDDLWVDISAILRSEQEMELVSPVSKKLAVDSPVGLSFPDDDRAILNDYQVPTRLIHPPLGASRGSDRSEVHTCLPDEDSLISIDCQRNSRAELTPEGTGKEAVSMKAGKFFRDEEAFIEYQTPTSSSNSNNVEKYHISVSEPEISLPDEDSLITVEDLIGFCGSKKEPTQGKANSEAGVSEKDYTDFIVKGHDKRASEASKRVSSSINKVGSMIQHEQHCFKSYHQNPCTSISSRRSSGIRFMDRKSSPDIYCNSYTGLNHAHPRTTTHVEPADSDYIGEYSAAEQPTFFPQETGILCSGLNCVGAVTPAPVPAVVVPVLLYPPGATAYSFQ